MKKSQQSKLGHALDMLIENPFDRIDVTELARRCKMTRTGFYLAFPAKRGEMTSNIVREIVGSFLKEVDLGVNLGLRCIDCANEGPSGQLRMILRSITRTFTRLPIHGKFVLIRLTPLDARQVFSTTIKSMKKSIDGRGVRKILSGDFAQLTSAELADIIFSMLWESLRKHFWNASRFEGNTQEVEFLRVLKVFFQDGERKEIQETIDAILKAK